ncbi:hypothetical protein VTJ04DRAFT_1008 [Mycothermus thermophilus]|uniref:uncharacterized protein n=1 Tax=Humicola insolens TaxID=85995 RepID=UPI003743ED23
MGPCSSQGHQEAFLAGGSFVEAVQSTPGTQDPWTLTGVAALLLPRPVGLVQWSWTPIKAWLPLLLTRFFSPEVWVWHSCFLFPRFFLSFLLGVLDLVSLHCTGLFQLNTEGTGDTTPFSSPISIPQTPASASFDPGLGLSEYLAKAIGLTTNGL